jgi:quercetin dioxygenase-like cupin family protein
MELIVEKDVIINLNPPIVEERGTIQMLVDFTIGSALVITSKAGSTRGNHYHKVDDHYAYLVKGRIEYYYRTAGSDVPPNKLIIEPGQMFYTPPMIEHTMKFSKDSIFYVFAKKHRDQDSYESDIVRVNLA